MVLSLIILLSCLYDIYQDEHGNPLETLEYWGLKTNRYNPHFMKATLGSYSKSSYEQCDQ